MLIDYIEQLCDTFRDAICVTDREGIVVLVNKKHAELTGLARENMLGRNVRDMVQDGILDVVLNPRIVESGQNVSSVQNVHNGRTVLLDGNPVKDADGRVVYVVTVIRDITALTELREEITHQRELLETFQNMRAEGVTGNQYPRVVRSQSMQRLYSEAAGIAETDATVLLLGETGVGKDVVARHIHATSQRADAPFVKVDCGSIPENLIETELFGYVPGSFSGASKNGKAGLVEAASGGTLFLDEIGELPMMMQSRLLRVLQDWEVLRVGATTPKKVDVRVIAATNKDLEHEVARNAFRSDLYYRLKVAVLHIPPLRSRKVDILPLAQSFLSYYGRKYRKNMHFSPEAEAALEDYSWPGNVRELENLVQGLVVTCRQGVIEARDMVGIRPRARREQDGVSLELPSVEGRSLKAILKDVENAILKAGLKRYGSISELSRQCQMDRSTIFRKVRELEADKGRG
ncbi:MAG: sigma 54-interacting transcriptional regulator [Desulfovibrio sp.]|nr:sigma 54-interacting transcriptional regulator [Desulfovibrio sp.]